ncbi:MAG: hypothetical protein E5Y10_24980 [Mesorhizobium sp.]|nr:MAG: hypothetical protein E5Y10_24980 [Mesorhizobium sp.]
MLIAGYACRYGVCTNENSVVAAGAFTGLLKPGFSPKMLFGHEGEAEVGSIPKVDAVARCAGPFRLTSPAL